MMTKQMCILYLKTLFADLLSSEIFVVFGFPFGMVKY